ncbi:hypothetical protein [Methylobacillus sp.]
MASAEKIGANQGDDLGKKPGIVALLLSVFCVLGVGVGILALLKSRAAG